MLIDSLWFDLILRSRGEEGALAQEGQRGEARRVAVGVAAGSGADDRFNEKPFRF